MAEKLRICGKILSVRITKTAKWWFASLSVEMPDPPMLSSQRPAVGIDVGVNRLATCSDGSYYENQRILATKLKKWRHANKRLHRRVKGSARREKARKLVARLHYEVSCLREDVLHKLTTKVAEQFAVIGVETLNLAGMVKNRRLARSLSDAALGKLLRFLSSKAAVRGGKVVKVARFFPSSQLCSCCGWRWDSITLSDRVFLCQNPDCQQVGVPMDRDFNASLNILQEALRLLAEV